MAKKLSTREFSDATGIPVSSVSRLLREGRFKGTKVSGKWLIDQSEVNSVELKAFLKEKPAGAVGRYRQVQKSPGKKEKKTAPEHTRQSYSVAEFSDRTFLTARGVEEFLRQGRLQGFRDEEGNWRLGPENLQNPNIRHLIR